MFYFKMGLRSIPTGSEINERIAVRGLAFLDNKVLFIQTNAGALKIPGGGVESNESYPQALSREFMEETGYHITAVAKKVGTALQQRADIYDSNKYFKMKSFYYLCGIDIENVGNQNLGAYEADMGMRPVFISLKNALKNNEAFLSENKEDQYEWVLRDTLAIGYLLRDAKLKII